MYIFIFLFVAFCLCILHSIISSSIGLRISAPLHISLSFKFYFSPIKLFDKIKQLIIVHPFSNLQLFNITEFVIFTFSPIYTFLPITEFVMTDPSPMEMVDKSESDTAIVLPLTYVNVFVIFSRSGIVF